MTTGMQLVELIRNEKAEPPSGVRTLGLDITHRWITLLSPGQVELEWRVDSAYFNLEGALICSWISALGDQALFFASNTLCGEGEGTRMAEFSLSCISNIEVGTVKIVAAIEQRAGDRMYGSCSFFTDDEVLAARMTATLDVIR